MRLARLNEKQLIRRGVAAPVARLVTAATHPVEHVTIFVQPVNPRWDFYIPSDADDVLGLWDDNADAYARWRRGGVTEYVLLYHDEPDHRLVARTEQGLLAELVRRYHDMLDWHDERASDRKVRAFADYVGFRHTDRLLDYLASDSGAGDFYEEFRSLFGNLE